MAIPYFVLLQSTLYNNRTSEPGEVVVLYEGGYLLCKTYAVRGIVHFMAKVKTELTWKAWFPLAFLFVINSNSWVAVYKGEDNEPLSSSFVKMLPAGLTNVSGEKADYFRKIFTGKL